MGLQKYIQITKTLSRINCNDREKNRCKLATYLKAAKTEKWKNYVEISNQNFASNCLESQSYLV